jgi:hypothetical protein
MSSRGAHDARKNLIKMDLGKFGVRGLGMYDVGMHSAGEMNEIADVISPSSCIAVWECTRYGGTNTVPHTEM